ncbi:microfibril-associated glycoprotein 4 isoform X3 [Coregonus clupeaformis]|uniref:microfibril-associated glycoprotein 4 isoform X3 n=1 Tax=Coregonus clupeaformis TaxID=59861 RepID=UPI001BE01207|nr:microfibril-associated glycoprotein 4 isoform X3 [Coregonus clupeaformis]
MHLCGADICSVTHTVNCTKVSFKGKRTSISTTMFSLLLALLFPVVVQSSLHPVDCNEVYRSGFGLNGVYTIHPAGPTSPVQVFCDMSMDSAYLGKWTVIQNRQDGSVNFHRKWDEYKSGFGSAAGEHWLGLETMHLLTTKGTYELRVDMEDFEGKKVYAQYSSFSVGPEAEGYLLKLGSFKDGGAGDSMTHQSGQKSLFLIFRRFYDSSQWSEIFVFILRRFYDSSQWSEIFVFILRRLYDSSQWSEIFVFNPQEIL